MLNPPKCMTEGTGEEQVVRIGFVLRCLGESLEASRGDDDMDFRWWIRLMRRGMEISEQDAEWFRAHCNNLLNAAGIS